MTVNFHDLPNSPWSARSDYEDHFPGGHITSFPQTNVGTPGGPGLWLDANRQQVWYVDDNYDCQRVAGVHGKAGFRDGAGAQALFNMGGFYRVVTAAVQIDPITFLIADQHNFAIRKLVKGTPWMVSTWLTGVSVDLDTMILDADHNLWLCPSYAGAFQKYDLNANLLATYPVPSRVWQGAALDNTGRISILSKQNACSQLWRLNANTGVLTHAAGISDEDHKLPPQNDQFLAFDGPAKTAFLYTASMVYTREDGRRVRFGGGDTGNMREYNEDDDTVKTFMEDGTMQFAVGVRDGAHLYTAYGKDPITGYPNSRRATFENFGSQGTALFKRITITGGPTPPNGGTVAKGFLDGVTGDIVRGWEVDGTAPVTVSIQIDAAAGVSVLADKPRPDLVPGQAAEPNHGVEWKIPDSWKDGKPHTLKIVYKGVALPVSGGNGSSVTFNIPAPIPIPPDPIPPTGATLTIAVKGTVTLTQTGGTPGPNPTPITSIVVTITP